MAELIFAGAISALAYYSFVGKSLSNLRETADLQQNNIMDTSHMRTMRNTTHIDQFKYTVPDMISMDPQYREKVLSNPTFIGEANRIQYECIVSSVPEELDPLIRKDYNQTLPIVISDPRSGYSQISSNNKDRNDNRINYRIKTKNYYSPFVTVQ